MLSLERLEHGLVEIKKSVSPHHECASWISSAGPCIVVRLLQDLREPVTLDGLGMRERDILSLMMQMNDAGVSWHKIIDSVLAMTGANAVAKREEAKELLPV